MGVAKSKKLSRLSEALLEMAGDLHRVGIMDDAAYRKITIRHLGPSSEHIETYQRRESPQASQPQGA